jgi:hypothetical protein
VPSLWTDDWLSLPLDTYSHVLPGLQAAAAEALDSILADPGLAEARQQSVSKAPSPAPGSEAVEGSFVRETWWAVLDSNQ